MLVITTAGFDRTSICWEVRQNAEREADWFFSARGRCASWISEAWLEQQRRTLPAHVYARLHESRWVEGAGAFLLEREVDAIFTSDLPPMGPGPRAIGLDLGITRDAAVAAVVRRDLDTGLVIVEALETWEPRGGKIHLPDVEDDVAELARRFGAPLIADPYQGVLLAQRLREKGVAVMEFTFTSESRRRLFGTLLDLIRSGRIRARPHEALERELLGLEVAETAAGWRVDHKRAGHDDHVIAVALAAQHVADQAPIDFKAGVVLGKPRASARLFASGLPRHSDEAEYDRRAIWRDSPWGDLR
jgi:hypothetical protein